jgi:hypothetical protein
MHRPGVKTVPSDWPELMVCAVHDRLPELHLLAHPFGVVLRQHGQDDVVDSGRHQTGDSRPERSFWPGHDSQLAR